MRTYFITGASGTIGSNVVKALLEKNDGVIAATRHPEKSAALFGDKVESVSFDYDDASTFDHALEGDGIFLLGPPLYSDLFNLLVPFVDFLVSNKYSGRIVYLSAYGMDEMEELPFHRQMEDKLKASALDWTIVRPGFFMQNFGNYERENIEERNMLFSPAGNGKTPFVSAVDVGSAVAELLVDLNRSKEIHILTGAVPYSYFDIAEILSDITGKKIVYPNPNDETYRKVLKESGAPDMIADYMLPVYRLIKNGIVEETHQGVQELTGNKPEELRVVLERDFG
ncbi:MAG: SDR family oxidoreductase [Bacteroidota bacterium]